MKARKGYRPIKMITHERDKELVVSALAGDQKSYNDLLRKYKPILYTAAKRRMFDSSVEDIEDVVMIVLGNSFVKMHQYNPEKSLFFTWMIACLHNYVNGIPNHKKRIKATPLEEIYPSSDDDTRPIEYSIPDIDSFDSNMDREQISKLIRMLIDKLPPDLSKAITMKYFKESSNQEIADAVGCTVSDVWYKIKKAKDMLKKMSNKDDLF